MRTQPPWVEELLGFWFGELTYQQWFKRADAVDAMIASRFAALQQRLAAEPLPNAMPPARETLAWIIALDQLPRNLYRGKAGAFATEEKALTLARRALGAGLDGGMSVHERLFLYLPFEHSEDGADQDTSVRLFSALGDTELIRFAERHREIIRRFGRFPHRNAALGRPTTAQEAEFLVGPDSSF